MKTVTEAMDMMDRVSRLEDTLDELSTRVKHDPHLRDLPEWRAILDRVKGCGMDLGRLTVAEFDELERWARRVRVWRTRQELD